MICKRFAQANNRYCDNYDPLKESTFLAYYDANNLYGWAMSQHLPTGNFRWIKDETEIAELNIETLPDGGKTGYILEVDLDYPDALHDKHNDYPLAAERLLIKPEMLSPFQRQSYPGRVADETATKLAPNLYHKRNYVVHFRNLKYYLMQGMQLRKVHKVLAFDQTEWLKVYIDFNTNMRKNCGAGYGKDFYKLMNNAVFGKTQENLRNRVCVEAITDVQTSLKRVASPLFTRSFTINEDLVIIQRKIATLKLDKPIYVGYCVLELSKLLMYEFHYDKMMKWYPNAELCFTDTDSLLYEIRTENIYEDLKNGDRSDEFDFSDYPHGADGFYLHSNRNKKKLGVFKDELNGIILKEFVGLRPKSYSLWFLGEVENNRVKHRKDTEIHKSKGTQKKILKRYIRHSHYVKCHSQLKEIRVIQNSLKSVKHAIGTYNQKRIGLSAWDTKRWVCECNIKTYAYGHYRTRTATAVE